MRIKSIISSAIITLLSLQLFSCGYFIHPERRGQKKTQNLDWTIVGLDAIGLLFFIIPGVIAFIVDFDSNTIYLPHGKRASLDDATKITFSKAELAEKGIAGIIADRTGKDVKAADIKLSSAKEFQELALN